MGRTLSTSVDGSRDIWVSRVFAWDGLIGWTFWGATVVSREVSIRRNVGAANVIDAMAATETADSNESPTFEFTRSILPQSRRLPRYRPDPCSARMTPSWCGIAVRRFTLSFSRML